MDKRYLFACSNPYETFPAQKINILEKSSAPILGLAMLSTFSMPSRFIAAASVTFVSIASLTAGGCPPIQSTLIEEPLYNPDIAVSLVVIISFSLFSHKWIKSPNSSLQLTVRGNNL